MKLFTNENSSTSVSVNDDIAALIMDVVPLITNHLRNEMRLNRMPNLSVPQLRTLVFLYHHQNASLSQVADYVGLKPPSMSKMVNALVVRKLIIRRASAADRRCIRLRLSSSGLEALMRSRRRTETRLAQMLAVLTAEQQAGIITALRALRPLFVKGQESASKSEK